MFEWYIAKEKLPTREPLCPSCAHAQFMKGRWASERVVLCRLVPGPLQRVQFAVLECSSYCERGELEREHRLIRGFAEAA